MPVVFPDVWDGSCPPLVCGKEALISVNLHLIEELSFLLNISIIGFAVQMRYYVTQLNLFSYK
jgi:hypothetical protein